MQNPLLNLDGLPPFSQIKPEHIVPAVTQVLEANRAAIEHLLTTTTAYNWETFAHPINELNDRLNRLWSPIEHLQAVADNEALRKAYKTCLPLMSDYRSEIGQNKALFEGYQAIANSAEFKQLDVAQQTIINNELRDFHLAGVDLPPEQQTRFKTIQVRLANLSQQFSENVLDASHAWKKLITDAELLAGLPDSTLALLKHNAEQEQQVGWLLTLDAPCYFPVMNYAENQALRQEIYTAFFTRASEQSVNTTWDNSVVMQEILALRHEMAALLGFANYAEYSLHTKMAETPQQVVDFLMDLAHRAKPVAQQELEDLNTFAQAHYGVTELHMWDVPYFSEKQRQHLYAISQETLRPYFPLNKVLEGLFGVINRLYGMQVKLHPNVDVWHPNVQFFDILDAQGHLRGQFYLDLYARKGKRSGAWMHEYTVRKRTQTGVQVPIAYMVCNFSPPVGETPSLLTHQDVTTLFHEFGHGLHHMLTQVDYPPVSGINGVAWDAVELPSQFMENWAWEKAALDLFAEHYQTGERLPDDLFEKMQAAKNFQAGLFMLRQLELALFDFRLHWEYTPDINIQALLDEVREQIAVLKPPSFNRFQNSFHHIFAGGYAAGYYSYKWAEVLSADAFAKFEEQGIFDRTTGLAFLHEILEKGGSQDAMQLFVAFRGREPTIDALLKNCGMAA